MKIWHKSLSLQFKESYEAIDLAHQIVFFHGKISSGKSSIMRLIDYCLGGDLERTPAIDREFVSATLNLEVKEFDVLLERQDHSGSIQVTWKDQNNNMGSVNAPIISRSEINPIWGDNIFNFSDLMFYLLGYKPFKVRRSKLEEDSPLVRLSFRDFLWYCYLDQDNLDSDFFNLDDVYKRLKEPRCDEVCCRLLF